MGDREPGEHRPDDRELAATAVLRLDLDEVSAKCRGGGANDDPQDLDLPYWAGVVPVRSVRDTPVPHPALPPEQPLPAYLRDAH